MSQHGQTTPTSAPQVTTVKTTQFETARVAANSPVAGTTVIDMSSSGAAVVDMSAAAKGSAKAVSKTPPIPQVKTTAGAAPSPPTGGTTATAVAGMAASAAQAKPASKDPAKSTAPDPAKSAKPAVAVAPAAAAVGLSRSGKNEAAKLAQPKVQVEVAPPPAKAAKEAPALDPFDALASILPSETPLVLPEPVYTGPEVHEHGITPEEGVLCGVREDTLPPNYRYENVPPAPADAKPKDVPKPMSTNEALDSLSFGFMTAPATAAAATVTPAKQEKMESVDAGFSNFAPPPSASVKSPAPPADKKAKIDTVSEGFSLMGALSSPAPPQKPVETKPAATTVPQVQIPPATVPKVQAPAPPVPKVQAPAPPVPKVQTPAVTVPKVQAAAPTVPKVQAPAPPVPKVQTPAATVPKVQAPAPTVPKVQAPAKPKTDAVDAMSLDALAALGDTLGDPEPVAEVPELRPEDIVSEAKLEEEEGVLVGVREDTLPPAYRFSEEKLKDLPAPKPEPTLAPGEALDFLAGDFMTCPTTAPVVQAPVVIPSAPPAQEKVETLSALDALAGDFMTPSQAAVVQAPLPSLAKKTPKSNICDSAKPNTTTVVTPKKPEAKPALKKDDSLSLDALSALSDTLAASEPAPEPPKLRPEDIVSEAKLEEEEGVLVGVREDTLPPGYRFSEEKLKDLPAPKPEPTLNTGEALDFLSGDFMTPVVCPPAQALPASAHPPTAQSKHADAAALDALAGDFVATAVIAPAVKCATSQPAQTSRQMSEGTTSALDALSDTLADIKPVPEPAPLPMKDIAKEKTVTEERLIKMGENDDTLPPEYRPTEEDQKAAAKEEAAKAPKEKPMGEAAALDLLSDDFAIAPGPAVAAPMATPCVVPSAPCLAPAPELTPPVLDSQPLKPMAGTALDSLAGTLLPSAMEGKTKGEKPKGKSKSRSKSKKHHAEDPYAVDQLSAELSKDVVSTKKGGKS